MTTAEIYSADAGIKDPKSAFNKNLVAEIIKAYDDLPGPRVGDFVIFPDGHEERIAHNWWGDAVQTTDGKFGASFYIGKGGYSSFSGGLNPSIDIERFERMDATKIGHFWTFDLNWPRAHSAIYLRIDCRVYRVLEEAPGTRTSKD